MNSLSITVDGAEGGGATNESLECQNTVLHDIFSFKDTNSNYEEDECTASIYRNARSYLTDKSWHSLRMSSWCVYWAKTKMYSPQIFPHGMNGRVLDIIQNYEITYGRGQTHN